MTSTGDAVLHPERGDTNVALQRTINFGTVDEDFANADLVIERRLRWPRSGGTPIETVGATAHYDRGTGKFTIHANTSMYNYVGWLIAVSLKVDPPPAQHRADRRRRQLRQQALLPQGLHARRHARRAPPPAGRSSIWKTASTT